MISYLISFFLIGMEVGNFLGSKRTEAEATKILKHYFEQKKSLWDELKRITRRIT